MGDFSLSLDKFRVKTREQGETVTRKIAIEAYRRIILRTPVKSGRARNNWFCTIGSASEEVTEEVSKSTTRLEGSIGASESSAAIAATARIRGMIQTVTAWKPASGPSIFLTNNLPYIVGLDNGSSSQAPNGIVEVTMTELGAIEREAAT